MSYSTQGRAHLGLAPLASAVLSPLAVLLYAVAVQFHPVVLEGETVFFRYLLLEGL